MKLYVTYSLGSKLKHCYSVVEGLDYGVCRRMVEAGTNCEFAFCYTEDEFAGQVERYGLKPVLLQPQGPIEK